jgi:ATP-binding cassette subfamily B protein
MSHVELPRLLVPGRRGRLAVLVGLGLAQAALAVVAALLVRRTFDAAITGHQPVARSAAGLVAVALAAAWLRSRERVVAERFGQGYVHAVRLQLFDAACRADARALQQGRHGTNALRFSGDLNALRRWISLGIARLVVAATAATGTLIGLAFLSAPLAAVAAAIVAAGAVASLRLTPSLYAAAVETRRRRARISAHVGEALRATVLIQASGQERRERDRLQRRSRTARDAAVAQARRAGRLLAAAELTIGAATAATLLVGSAEVHAGRATPGTVVAAMGIVGLLVANVRDLGRVPEYHQTARASREALGRFLTRLQPQARPRTRASLPDGPGRIDLHGIGVDGVLDDISVVAEPGARIAVIGANGSGKSTVIKLLAGLLRPDRGRIEIDGADLATHAAGSEIGLAAPDVPLLRGSIEHNVRYRIPDADPAEVGRLLDACGLDGRRRVLEDGHGLSSGERMRVEIARALLGSPRVLLLDEPERNLDAEGLRTLVTTLSRLPASTTIVIATHEPALMSFAADVWHVTDRAIHVTPHTAAAA